jgi:hypothetical protein
VTDLTFGQITDLPRAVWEARQDQIELLPSLWNLIYPGLYGDRIDKSGHIWSWDDFARGPDGHQGAWVCTGYKNEDGSIHWFTKEEFPQYNTHVNYDPGPGDALKEIAKLVPIPK